MWKLRIVIASNKQQIKGLSWCIGSVIVLCFEVHNIVNCFDMHSAAIKQGAPSPCNDEIARIRYLIAAIIPAMMAGVYLCFHHDSQNTYVDNASKSIAALTAILSL